MKELFAILFFGKTVLLTPNPVSIDGRFELMLDEPITAVTGGASLQIDVSSTIQVTTISETRQTVSSRFPDGCLSAVLFGANGEVILQDNGTSISNRDVRITLASVSGVPVGDEFSRIEVQSCLELTDVEIYWKNHKK